MRKRTNMNLDHDLVRRAAQELGTRTMTDTVNAALQEVTDRAARLRAAEFIMSRLTPETVDEMRRDREFDFAEPAADEPSEVEPPRTGPRGP